MRRAFAALLVLGVSFPALAQSAPSAAAPAETPAPAAPATTAPEAAAAAAPAVEASPPLPERSYDDMPLAVLQGLDKVTARTSTFTAKVGEPASFGLLEVKVRACKKAPPIDPPESAAFLDITEKLADGSRVLRFSGWMFASSPALSALEHPVYDVWVKDCRKADTKAGSSKSP